MANTQQAREWLAHGRVQDALQLIDELMQNGHPGAELLLLHAQALLAAGRARDAIPAFHRAIESAPNHGIVELGLAIACGQSGDAASAERAARHAIAKGYDNAGSRFVLARAMLGQSRHQEAEEAFRHVLRLQPGDTQALINLGEAIWQRTGSAEHASAIITELSRSASPELALFQARLARESRGDEAELAMLEQELEQRPSHLALRLAAVRAALMCDAERALKHAEIAISGGGGQHRNVVGLYGDALLGAGRAQEASDVAGRLLDTGPDDGHAIALQASAWRMLGDPRYGDLYDYRQFVFAQTIDTPPGWSDLPSYLKDLTRSLRMLHGSRSHPLDQTLRGGSQVDLWLERSDDRALHAFRQAVDGPISRYLQMLGSGEDRFRRRNRGAYRFNGTWSALLRPHGYHSNHYHGQGWISSACYIDMPASLGKQGGEGWLQFGEPVMPTHPPLPAEYFVKPEPGLLVLFPSWMWHGTVPFSGAPDVTRLTIAFDLVPA